MTYSPGGVLALDLSSTIGTAYGSVHAPAPVFASWKLPHEGGEGARYASFENSLADAMDIMQPASVVLEAALSLQALTGHTTFRVVCQQLTLRGIAYAEAWRASVPISEVGSSIVRLALLGRAHFAKGSAKREVIAYCRGRGWKVPDDHSADACLVWAWQTMQLRGGSAVAGPLFRERALQ